MKYFLFANCVFGRTERHERHGFFMMRRTAVGMEWVCLSPRPPRAGRATTARTRAARGPPEKNASNN